MMIPLFLRQTLLYTQIRSCKPGLLSRRYSTTNSRDVRVNQFNIQLLPQYIRDHIFGVQRGNQEDIQSDLVEKAKEHLTSHGIDFSKGSLLGDVPKPPLVELQGRNIRDHFDSIAFSMLEPYLAIFDKLCSCRIPEPPVKWEFTPGWVRYDSGSHCEVAYPEESALVLDVETCMAVGPDPVLATAVSPTCWYSWVSPRLVRKQYTEWNKQDLIRDRTHLIPIRPDADTSSHRIIVGHNVSFDRSRLREEYNLAESNTYFVDTMALHMCVNGVTTSQRGRWLRAEGEDREELPGWMSSSSPGALHNLYQLYLGKRLDKAQRDMFTSGTLEEIGDNFQNGIIYCAKDSMATLEIFQCLLPLFKQSCPSPVTILGMMQMGNSYMPTRNKDWLKFVTNCDEYHNNTVKDTSLKLRVLADTACSLSQDNLYLLDPWMSSLDWSILETKNKTNKVVKWYKKELGVRSEQISPQKRIVPLLLRLVWEENPLHFVEHLGWGYIVPASAGDTACGIYSLWIDYLDKYTEFLQADQGVQSHTLLQEVRQLLRRLNNADNSCTERFNVVEKITSLKEENLTSIKTAQILTKMLKLTYETKFGKCFGRITLPGFDIPFDFYRIPHKDGEKFNCGKPLGREYEFAMRENIMKSRVAKSGAEILRAEKFISFWRSNHQRIKNQMIVNVSEEGSEAVILPNLCVSGTVTRRAVQSTWLTASNAEGDRVGSELKSLITAPPGYVLVGADVDAQELWIASLLSDSHFARIHGCTGIGWMTLQGDKSSGTDLHSRTANSLGITRNQAKVLNYARIYSSGLALTVQLLSKFLPNASLEEVTSKAKQIYAQTKGIRVPVGSNDDMFLYRRTDQKESHSALEWSGGTESYLFNKLEEIANRREPRTPALNCRISSALLPNNVSTSYYTSRLNWVVQSSGVDYLHLLLVSMKWIMESYGISGRYCLSIHDDIRFLVREEDAERAVLALQLSNLYTRCLFSYMTSVPDLPLSVAFFSAVEIDKVLRKDPTDECVTPSNPDGLYKARGIQNGKSFDIQSILKLVDTLDKVHH